MVFIEKTDFIRSMKKFLSMRIDVTTHALV